MKINKQQYAARIHSEINYENMLKRKYEITNRKICMRRVEIFEFKFT